MKLGELITINPESITKNYPYKLISYIDISSVGTGILYQMKKLPIKKAPKRAKRIIREGDILLATVRPNLRAFYYVKDIPRNAIASTGFAVLRANEEINSRYLYYVISNPSFTDYLSNNVKGAAYPAVDKETICRADIYLPSMYLQRKIASILSNYDDLIENNRKRIKILEEMAQNLYREWFVKFRFPGHENVRFVDSPLGEIPENFLGVLPDFIDFKEGPGLRRWQYRSEGIPFLNIRTLLDNNIDFSKVKYLDTKEVNSKYKHFLLKEYDHVVSSSGTIGRVVTIQKHHLPLMLNTSIIRMRPVTKKVGKWQLKHFLKSEYFQNQIHAFAIGAAQSNFGPSHLKQMYIITPPSKIGIMYENIVEPIEEKIGNLVRKNDILRKTRDLLLPKLVSGELDVSELDIKVPVKD